MYPELFRIGNFPINTYGVLLALGILIALATAARLAAKDGLQKDKIYDLGLWTIVGGLIGSKILLLVADETYRDNIWNVFSLDFLRSGGVYYGGFIGGLLTLALLIKFYKLPFWKVADAFAPGVALGQAIGRLGCFSAGCCWGKLTDLPWGVHFSEKGHEYTGVPIYDAYGDKLYLHPTQLYESVAMLLVFLILLWLHSRRKFDGQVLIVYAITYAIVRFVIEFFRADPRGDLFGLTTTTELSTSQLISLLVATIALAFLFIRLKTRDAAGSR
ncbi:MAG: prolipoprotein diacylglyceryl transferase [Pyrinomonadaceae bacterium]|nr:prolipoprotein diacylglyceryl transferase [Pyrinomonadaceae bacterium]MCX7640546.1 prolipoprotein diacylglyceryl transferase [Pyrinomonadaceae bacterium]MDW8303873.1 prolipoprotein diacylglyceryl transferase [Acidobacteriota bacterium]